MSQIVNQIRAQRGENSRIIFAALHLPGLPGSPHWYQAGRPSLEAITTDLLTRAAAFAKAGFDGFVLENFGDAPFFADSAPAITTAIMAILASELKRSFDLPFGINVLRNDGHTALAIAKAAGADFIRVNVLNSTSVTDQGLISGQAATLLREREHLDCGPTSETPVEIWADVHVKHARPLGELDVAVAANDLVLRSGADIVIVSGKQTGSAPDEQRLTTVRDALRAKDVVFAGSGLKLSNLHHVLPHIDGGVVASSVLKNGVAGAAVDEEAASRFIAAVREFEARE